MTLFIPLKIENPLYQTGKKVVKQRVLILPGSRLTRQV